MVSVSFAIQKFIYRVHARDTLHVTDPTFMRWVVFRFSSLNSSLYCRRVINMG